jgi:hypothetical protein
MRYALIHNLNKVILIKEIDIDKINFKLIITSMKDETYVEEYQTSDEAINRLLELNGGFNSYNIKKWWYS